MKHSTFICIFILFIQLTYAYEYIDDDYDDKQIAVQSFLPVSDKIHYLNSSVFDLMLKSNVSFSYNDETIYLNDLGISSIESNTFVNCNLTVKSIILASNFLSYLPRNVFYPFNSTLSSLNLQRNQFRTLVNNHFLRHLEHLRTLDLSKNQLYELYKQDFIGLKRLETLILRENKLTYLSYALFSRCRTIVTLDLSDNQISLIDSNAFRSLFRLKVLLLSNNPFGQRSLTYTLIQPLKNLEYLDLENTNLHSLSPYLFYANQHLKSIKLRRNKFYDEYSDSHHSLKRTFCYANSLIEIDLVSTNLHSLDVCTYDQIPSLRRLYLMNNPLHCACDLFYLKYGDIYRVLLMNNDETDYIHNDIDAHLDRWISRPELRRHLEKSHARGDFHRLPIELSLFARCSSPQQWSGREISNITGIFRQCQHRWSNIEQECQDYCQLDRHLQSTTISTNSTISARANKNVLFHVQFYIIVFVFLSYI